MLLKRRMPRTCAVFSAAMPRDQRLVVAREDRIGVLVGQHAAIVEAGHEGVPAGQATELDILPFLIAKAVGSSISRV